MSHFDDAFDFTIGNEGGYSNHPQDRGGPTNWGITQVDLSRWYGHPTSIQEVKDMSKETAKAIYKKHYWDSLALDQVTSKGISMCMFDIGVVRGIGIPPKYAQGICNAHGSHLVLDGHIGPKTLLEINATVPSVFIQDFANKTRLGFLGIVATRPSQVVFLKGWLNRAKRLLTLRSV